MQNTRAASISTVNKLLCRTDSKKPHHCSYPWNKVENMDYMPDTRYTLQSVGRYPPPKKTLPLPLERSGPT